MADFNGFGRLRVGRVGALGEIVDLVYHQVRERGVVGGPAQQQVVVGDGDLGAFEPGAGLAQHAVAVAALAGLAAALARVGACYFATVAVEVGVHLVQGLGDTVDFAVAGTAREGGHQGHGHRCFEAGLLELAVEEVVQPGAAQVVGPALYGGEAQVGVTHEGSGGRDVLFEQLPLQQLAGGSHQHLLAGAARKRYRDRQVGQRLTDTGTGFAQAHASSLFALEAGKDVAHEVYLLLARRVAGDDRGSGVLVEKTIGDGLHVKGNGFEPGRVVTAQLEWGLTFQVGHR